MGLVKCMGLVNSHNFSLLLPDGLRRLVMKYNSDEVKFSGQK